MHPIRKKLPHEQPAWVADDSRYFVTINATPRGGNPLLQEGRADRLLDGLVDYERLEKWTIWVAVVMPDHLHMIATFSRLPGLRAIVSAWKRYHARILGIEWQSDFFEHRIRNDAEFTEKFHYVLLNPVRRHLVSDWRDWPHRRARGEW